MLSIIIVTSNNQRLGNAGEDDAFLPIWLMKDLGPIGRKDLFCGVENLVHEDTPRAPIAFSSILTPTIG